MPARTPCRSARRESGCRRRWRRDATGDRSVRPASWWCALWGSRCLHLDEVSKSAFPASTPNLLQSKLVCRHRIRTGCTNTRRRRWTVAASKGAPDLYSQFLNSAPGAFIAKQAGLPQPENLRRYKAGEPALAGPIVIGGSGRLVEPLRELLSDYPAALPHDDRYGALVFDATGITQVTELVELFEFFQPIVRKLAP